MYITIIQVYSELLRDLQAFVADRVGDAVHLNIPKLYHGGGGEDEQVGPCLGTLMGTLRKKFCRHIVNLTSALPLDCILNFR